MQRGIAQKTEECNVAQQEVAISLVIIEAQQCGTLLNRLRLAQQCVVLLMFSVAQQ